MNYLDNKTIKELLALAPNYRKKEKTALRVPLQNEIGKEITTYVAYDNTIRVESVSIIQSNSIIARNNKLLAIKDGEEIYNDWPISSDVVIKNYGQEVYDSLTHEFSSHSKIKTIKAILLNKDILEILNIKENILLIPVSWSDIPMRAMIGDYLTDEGYSISQEDMKAYEIIS